MRTSSILASLIFLALGSASCTIIVDPEPPVPAPPVEDFERFQRDWGWGPCPPGEDCSGFIELTADGTLRLDTPCPSDIFCNGLPPGTHQATISATDLEATATTLLDPELIRLLDQPEPPCPAPTDIGESMTLVVGGEVYANTTTLCSHEALELAREALARLVSKYFEAPLPELELVAAGWSFGECLGPCQGDLAFDNEMVQYTIRDWASGTPPHLDNIGVLTDVGRYELDVALAMLNGVMLEERYGCPDCADGGASQVTLARSGTISTHTYEYGFPPMELAPLDALLTTLMEALETCSASPLVTIGPGCVPLGE